MRIYNYIAISVPGAGLNWGQICRAVGFDKAILEFHGTQFRKTLTLNWLKLSVVSI